MRTVFFILSISFLFFVAGCQTKQVLNKEYGGKITKYQFLPGDIAVSEKSVIETDTKQIFVATNCYKIKIGDSVTVWNCKFNGIFSAVRDFQEIQINNDEKTYLIMNN